MKDTIKYVGLDVSKEKIAVAVADKGRGEARYIGMFPNTVESIRKFIKKLGSPDTLRVCYEAGPTGYSIYRLLISLNIECQVIAPSLIPQKLGSKVKKDRRDALVEGPQTER